MCFSAAEREICFRFPPVDLSAELELAEACRSESGRFEWIRLERVKLEALGWTCR
jgi:hypothetical protein